MQCHLLRYQNKPSEKAEHFVTPHETANQQHLVGTNRELKQTKSYAFGLTLTNSLTWCE